MNLVRPIKTYFLKQTNTSLWRLASINFNIRPPRCILRVTGQNVPLPWRRSVATIPGLATIPKHNSFKVNYKIIGMIMTSKHSFHITSTLINNTFPLPFLKGGNNSCIDRRTARILRLVSYSNIVLLITSNSINIRHKHTYIPEEEYA